MKRGYTLAGLAVAVALLAACASSGPVVPAPPSVAVTELRSTVITPELVKFRARIVIRNEMRGPLDIDKVDYGVDLQDRPMFTDSFSALHPMKARGRQTVTFPFQIAMADIGDQMLEILAEEGLKVTFHGVVYPAGFESIPFASTLTIPLPRMPGISFQGTRGSLLDRELTVLLRVHNPNTFAFTVSSVDSYVEINEVRYSLVQSEGATEIPSGGSGTVALTMRQSAGKTLSMVLNLAQSEAVELKVGGSIVLETPYGLVYAPVEVSGTTR